MLFLLKKVIESDWFAISVDKQTTFVDNCQPQANSTEHKNCLKEIVVYFTLVHNRVLWKKSNIKSYSESIKVILWRSALKTTTLYCQMSGFGGGGRSVITIETLLVALLFLSSILLLSLLLLWTGGGGGINVLLDKVAEDSEIVLSTEEDLEGGECLKMIKCVDLGE
jgi:hypothetical protein